MPTHDGFRGPSERKRTPTKERIVLNDAMQLGRDVARVELSGTRTLADIKAAEEALARAVKRALEITQQLHSSYKPPSSYAQNSNIRRAYEITYSSARSLARSVDTLILLVREMPTDEVASFILGPLDVLGKDIEKLQRRLPEDS